MRAFVFAPLALLLAAGISVAKDKTDAEQIAKSKAQCGDFGFKEGTDAFADCVMRLSLKQQRRQPPDHETLVRRYRDLSMARRGDDRYPVCSASNMDAELDITTNKWVGPNCQMAPD